MTTTIAYYAALNGEKIEKMESTYEGDLTRKSILKSIIPFLRFTTWSRSLFRLM